MSETIEMLEIGATKESWVSFLNERWKDQEPTLIIKEALRLFFPGKIAAVSSFGSDSALLLHFLALTDKNCPILFLDTKKHFTETLTYRDILVDRFGFSDVRSLAPDEAALKREDPREDLWHRDPDRCCALRKVLPLREALSGFNAWITGRKRHQSDERAELPHAELADGRIKINPLAFWSAEQIRQAFKHYRLPAHPLFDDGFASIGCVPCTRRIETGEHERAGRWSGTLKTECGIHIT